MSVFDGWDPAQYNRFATEREQPFWDLRRLLDNVSRPTVVDLGCGDGRLTAALAHSLDASSTVGVDASTSMIAEANEHSSAQLRFERADIGSWQETESCDVVFANASLHWVSDHRSVLKRWSRSLRDKGQLCVQVPANADHLAHLVAGQVAQQFMKNPPLDPVGQNVLSPENYSILLEELGFRDQHVRLQVYGHRLTSSQEVVEWVKGTTLTRFKEPLGGEWDRFVQSYQKQFIAEVGDLSPYFYPFKRILMWGRR